MQDVVNEFIPYPWKGSETYGGYCHRLEEAMIKITALDMPPESAVQALAFIAMEVPSDFDHCSIREVLPSRRMKDFLRRQPEEVRTLFRTEAMKYLPPKKDRVDWLLQV